MATAIGRPEAFTGELIRLYENGKNRPAVEARTALARVFGRSEAYIEFGVDQGASVARQEPAQYDVSSRALDVARRFDQLSAACQDHVSHQIDLLGGANARGHGQARAAQHDVVIRDGRRQGAYKKRNRRRN